MVKTVAFMGIDGAGKTTLIREIGKELRDCEVFYMGLGRDIRLPFLAKLMARHSTKKYKLDKPAERIERDNYRGRSFKWLVVYSLELYWRYFLAKLSRRKYVLFDRYFYDGLTFAGKRSFNFLKRVFPKPNKCFLIYAPAEVIRTRKQEAPVKDINRFYERMAEISKSFDVEVIDNTRDLEVVKRDILGRINGL